jgi:tetratricopeptide (TPR) repeat protein
MAAPAVSTLFSPLPAKKPPYIGTMTESMFHTDIARRRPIRAVVAATLLCLLAVAAARPALADQNDPRLPQLFDVLRKSDNSRKIEQTEAQIWRIWSRHGESASVDRLMQRAQMLMAADQVALAADIYDAIIKRDPEFAEGWNRRATLRFMTGDYDGSVADIQKVLALEPRHFGALAGLGMIYMAVDEPEGALRAFEAALAIHPHLPAARAHVGFLREQMQGKKL